jgi:predicted methyltransferase
VEALLATFGGGAVVGGLGLLAVCAWRRGRKKVRFRESGRSVVELGGWGEYDDGLEVSDRDHY